VNLEKAAEYFVAGLIRAAGHRAAIARPDVRWSLPGARYALENGDGVLRFYQVWRSRNGEAERLYVLHGPDGSDGSDGSALPRPVANAIVKKIEQAGTRECAIRYGNEIGACSKCGRRLTNTLSRELGIGPVCGGRMLGSEFPDEIAEARERIIARGEDPNAEVGE